MLSRNYTSVSMTAVNTHLGTHMLKLTLALLKVIAFIFPQGKGGNKPFQSDKPEGFSQVERYGTN